MPKRRSVRTVGVLAAVVALALSVTACAPAHTVAVAELPQVTGDLPASLTSQLSSAVTTAMKASGSSGAIVGVWAPWSGTWVTGLGTTGPKGKKVTTDMTFAAAAPTREMTCDVLYAMAADHTVSLNDDVAKRVPGVPKVKGATLGDLCDSTSGIASYGGQLMSRWMANPDREWNPRELMSYGLARGGAKKPGTTFVDSDTGYVLLGLALESASGRSMADLYDTYVFDPLTMTSSSLPSDKGEKAGRLSGWRSPTTGNKVDCAAPQNLTDWSASGGYAASGVVSTIDDLGTYARALASGARAYDVKGRFADPLPASPKAPDWFTAKGGSYQAGTLIGQYGSVPGYMTAAFSDPKSGLTVAVVLNNSRASSTLVRALAWQLAALAVKAPAAKGQTAPTVTLPWTADKVAASVKDLAVCPMP